jgi:hypothetical protein
MGSCRNLPTKSARRRLRKLIGNAAKRSFLWAMIGCTAMGAGGCTRAKYRYKTNREAYHIIDEKIAQSCEQTLPYRIEVDRNSRMYDPFNPDRPPMPEDDPVSNGFMRVVDRKKGYPLWEANGRTNTAENPQWWSTLPLDDRGVLVLSLDDAVRMALLHSSVYQQNKETLYLSALDVSSERFLFDSQFFSSWQTQYTADGRRRAGGGGESSSQTQLGFPGGRRNFTMQKQFASGADLLVGMANTFSWQVSGPDEHTARNILDFSLIQPLLRQGGRDVVLERLTLAERTLLANVRIFERYRRGFYMQIATGRQAIQGPSRRGGLFGGAGLEGFTGLGGGFGTVGNQGGNNQGFTDTGTPGAGGFLGLLQQQLTIINTRENIIRQRDNLLRLEDTYRELLLTIPDSQVEIPQQQLQVAQQQQSLYSIQTNLLQLNVTYETQLDTFKRLLGLPAYLCVEIQDPLLDQFNLISTELRMRRDQLNDIRANFGAANTKILNLSTIDRDPETKSQFRSIKDSNELQEQFKALTTSIGPLRQLGAVVIEQDTSTIRGDIQRLRGAIPTRKQQMTRLTQIVEQERDTICGLVALRDFDSSVLDSRGLENLPDQLTEDLDKLEKKFRSHLERADKLEVEIASVAKTLGSEPTDRKRFEAVSEKVVVKTQDLVASVAEDILALQLVQARARTESALLPEVDIDPREALDIARANRRDWLNNRAALVNSWRAIEVIADDLESVLDFTFSGDVQNVGDNPLALRSATGRLRVGLAWDAPITRLQERNRYRQVLIEYQQAKRSYYLFEDGVWQGLRTTLRSIRQNQLSFELQRYAVRNAAQQVSINEDLRQINETLSQASGPTAARDAVSALGDLLQSQNLLIGVWVNYEALRRNLDLDLETMQIDSEGLWIDPISIRPDTVGGQLGPAILNYGLNESEQLTVQKMQAMERMPTELAPTNQRPVDAQYVYGPEVNKLSGINAAAQPVQTTTPASPAGPADGMMKRGGSINVNPRSGLQNSGVGFPSQPMNYDPLTVAKTPGLPKR